MLKKLLFGGGGIKEPVEAVGSVLDSLFTSKEENRSRNSSNHS